MLTRLIVLVGLVFVAPDATPLLAPQQDRRRGGQEAGEYGWLSNLQAGQAEARKTGKPLMVVVRCVP